MNDIKENGNNKKRNEKNNVSSPPYANFYSISKNINMFHINGYMKSSSEWTYNSSLSFEKDAIMGYGTNPYVTKVIDGLLKILRTAAGFSLNFGILYHVNNLIRALEEYKKQQNMR